MYDGHTIGTPFNFQHVQGQSVQFRDPSSLAGMGADLTRMANAPELPPPRPEQQRMSRSFSDSNLQRAPRDAVPVSRTVMEFEPRRPVAGSLGCVCSRWSSHCTASMTVGPRAGTAVKMGTDSRAIAPPVVRPALSAGLANSGPVGNLPQRSQTMAARQPRSVASPDMSASRKPSKPWSSGQYVDPKTGILWVYDVGQKKWVRSGGRNSAPQSLPQSTHPQQPPAQPQQPPAQQPLPQSRQPPRPVPGHSASPAPSAHPPRREHSGGGGSVASSQGVRAAERYQARVLYDFRSTHPAQVSVSRGELVAVSGLPDDKGWIRVSIERGGMSLSGLVPATYIHRSTPVTAK